MLEKAIKLATPCVLVCLWIVIASSIAIWLSHKTMWWGHISDRADLDIHLVRLISASLLISLTLFVWVPLEIARHRVLLLRKLAASISFLKIPAAISLVIVLVVATTVYIGQRGKTSPPITPVSNIQLVKPAANPPALADLGFVEDKTKPPTSAQKQGNVHRNKRRIIVLDPSEVEMEKNPKR